MSRTFRQAHRRPLTWLAVVAVLAMAPLFLHAPSKPFAWRTAQPRGPPAIS